LRDAKKEIARQPSPGGSVKVAWRSRGRAFQLPWTSVNARHQSLMPRRHPTAVPPSIRGSPHAGRPPGSGARAPARHIRHREFLRFAPAFIHRERRKCFRRSTHVGRRFRGVGLGMVKPAMRSRLVSPSNVDPADTIGPQPPCGPWRMILKLFKLEQSPAFFAAARRAIHNLVAIRHRVAIGRAAGRSLVNCGF
jgi:hypothetical protein